VTVKQRMRVVGPDEVVAPKRKLMSLVEAVEKGDYLDILMAQRRDIVSSLPNEKGPAKAALHRQLALISKDIEGLELMRATELSVVATTSDEPFDPASI
jgi:hypothetical protein